jgi:hypothetical protein
MDASTKSEQYTFGVDYLNPTPFSSPILRDITNEDRKDLDLSLAASLNEAFNNAKLNMNVEEVWKYEQTLLQYDELMHSMQPKAQPHFATSNSIPIDTIKSDKNEKPSYDVDTPMIDGQRTVDPRTTLALSKVTIPPHTLNHQSPPLAQSHVTRASGATVLPRLRTNHAYIFASPRHRRPSPEILHHPSSGNSSDLTTTSSDTQDNDSPISNADQRESNATRYTPYLTRPPLLPPRPLRNGQGNYTPQFQTLPPRYQKRNNSYRSVPAFKQAISDRERNATLRIDAIKAEYDNKREKETIQLSHLTDQLNRAIAHYHSETDTRTQSFDARQKQLDARTALLDERTRYIEETEDRKAEDRQLVANWRDRLMTNTDTPAQADRLSRIYVLFADIIQNESNLHDSASAIKLHRKISPHLHLIASSIGTFIPPFGRPIQASELADRYYRNTIRSIQNFMYDDEWEQFTDAEVPFEEERTLHPRHDNDRDSSNSGDEW